MKSARQGTLRFLSSAGHEVVTGQAMRQRAMQLFAQGYTFWTYRQEPGQDAELVAQVRPAEMNPETDYLGFPLLIGG